MTDNQRGAALMTAAMAGFAVEDLFLKAAARDLPVGQILLVQGLAGALVFALMARRRGEAALPAAFAAPALLLRSAFEVAGRLFYALSIALTSVSETSAILQATPLVVIAGASVVFGERVGWQRWLAVGVAFGGVLLILQPGVGGFSALSLLAVAGMLGFAGRDLTTRAAPRGLSNRQLGTLGFSMLALAGALILSQTGGARWPGPAEAGMIAGCTLSGVLAYHALTAAMRTGTVAAVTPFRYTRLLFAIALAMLLLDERPDAATWAGSALIVGAGLYGLTRR